MEMMMVALGGGLGALCRYGVQLIITKYNYPFFGATLIVNFLGSFLIGFVGHKLMNHMTVTSFFVIGILGAFTTFSTFSFDVVKLMNENQMSKAIVYVFVTIVGGLLVCFIGWKL